MTENAPVFLTTKQAAQALGVHRDLLRRLARHSGDVRFQHVGPLWVAPLEAWEHLLKVPTEVRKIGRPRRSLLA